MSYTVTLTFGREPEGATPQALAAQIAQQYAQEAGLSVAITYRDEQMARGIMAQLSEYLKERRGANNTGAAQANLGLLQTLLTAEFGIWVTPKAAPYEGGKGVRRILANCADWSGYPARALGIEVDEKGRVRFAACEIVYRPIVAEDPNGPVWWAGVVLEGVGHWSSKGVLTHPTWEWRLSGIPDQAAEPSVVWGGVGQRLVGELGRCIGKRRGESEGEGRERRYACRLSLAQMRNPEKALAILQDYFPELAEKETKK